MYKRKEHGITLIALVITIIILLILAGVAISVLSGENGILGKAQNAVMKNEEGAAREKLEILILEARMYCIESGKNFDLEFLKAYINTKDEIEVEEEANQIVGCLMEYNCDFIIDETLRIVDVFKSSNLPKHSISYDANEGENAPKSVKRREGTVILSSIAPTRNGYTFKGWSLSADDTENILTSYELKEDTTFYAIWEIKKYKITYDLDGGEVAAENPTTYTSSSSEITLNNPIKEGYAFLGWTGSNGEKAQTSVTIASGSEGDKIYTANWKEIPTWSWTDADNNGIKSIGDVITYKNGDQFYIMVINNDDNKYVLLSENNIDTTTLKQSSTANTIVFSTVGFRLGENLNEKVSIINDTKSAVYYARQYAKEILKLEEGAGRLMTYGELLALGASTTGGYDLTTRACPAWINTSDYWLGTPSWNNEVYFVSGSTSKFNGTSYYRGKYGVRPVIEILQSKI